MSVEQTPQEAVHPDLHKAAASAFPSGVTLVGCEYQGEAHAITVSAFCSVSVSPPLVAVFVGSTSRIAEMIQASRVFAVSVLSEESEAISSHCAVPGRPPIDYGKEHGQEFRRGLTGSPVHSDAVSYFDCTLESAVETGDHLMFLGRVIDAGRNEEGRPLLYWSRGYRRLAI